MIPTQHLQVRIQQDEIRPHFKKRGLIRSLLPRPKPQANLPRIERIWFPYYLIDFQVTSSKGPGTMLCSVEAWSGSFAIFQLEDFLLDGIPNDDAPRFEPRITEEAAQESARKDLLHTIMRQRSRGAKPIPEAILSTGLIYYPLYIFYFQRKKNFIDIKLRDGVNGQGIGQRTKGGVLQAFLEQAQS